MREERSRKPFSGVADPKTEGEVDAVVAEAHQIGAGVGVLLHARLGGSGGFEDFERLWQVGLVADLDVQAVFE